jgi:hypothetical protein
MTKPDTVKCAHCGKEHPRAELEITFKRPDAIHALPKEQRQNEVKESDDYCLTKDGRFFLRGVLPLNVAGRDIPYRLGVWVEVDDKAYRRVYALWDDADQANEPALPASLANKIPLHADTLGLAVQLKLTGPKSRPDILIPPSGHSLHREQCEGISEHRVHEYSECF